MAVQETASDRACQKQAHGPALLELIRLSVPIMTASALSVSADKLSLAFVGHWDYKDVTHFDGAAIGKMYSNVTGLSIGSAAALGLATLCSQAHGAGRSTELNPVYLRRAVVVLGGCYLFSLVMAACCEPLLLALGQPPGVAYASARFAQIQFLGVPFFWLCSSMTAALNSTKRTAPGLTMSLGSSAAQVVMSWLLLSPDFADLGYLGLALGRALGGVVSFLILLVYVKLAGYEHLVWKRGPDAEPTFKTGSIIQFLQVSLPSAVVVWSEWWAFEILGLEVGLTPDAVHNLAAHGAMFGFVSVVYMCWTGTCNALNTLVGNRLGAHRNADIPPLLRSALFFSLVTSLLVALGFEVFKDRIAAFFTEDEEVRGLISSSSIVVVLSILLYAQLMTFFGAIRGANLQRYGIMGTLVGYWIVGLPAGAVLGCALRRPTPLIGVWLGNVIALAISAASVLISVFCRINWSTVRRLAQLERAPLLESGRQDAAAADTDDCHQSGTLQEEVSAVAA